MKIMEHETNAVYCDTDKCKRSGDDKREIRVDFIRETVTQPQAIDCPYCGETIERNIPGKVKRVTGDLRSGGQNTYRS